MFEVNVFGTLALTRAALGRLRDARGVVVTVGSLLGRVSAPYLGVYAASKHAQHAAMGALRAELCGAVDVCLVEPGRFDTGFGDRGLLAANGSGHHDASAFRFLDRWNGIAGRELGVVADPGQVADAVLRLVDCSQERPLHTVVGPDATQLIARLESEGAESVQRWLDGMVS